MCVYLFRERVGFNIVVKREQNHYKIFFTAYTVSILSLYRNISIINVYIRNRKHHCGPHGIIVTHQSALKH